MRNHIPGQKRGRPRKENGLDYLHCPHCLSAKFVKCGYVKLKKLPDDNNKLPKYRCKTCCKTFYDRTGINETLNRYKLLTQRLATHLFLAGVRPAKIVEQLVQKGFLTAPAVVREMEPVFKILAELDFIPKGVISSEQLPAPRYESKDKMGATLLIEERVDAIYIELVQGVRTESRANLNSIKHYYYPLI